MKPAKPLTGRQSRALFRAESRRIADARRRAREELEEAELRARYASQAPLPPATFPWLAS